MSDWLAAFSDLWDNDALYRRYSDQALTYAGRPEIDPAHIVPAFQAYLGGLL
jgi:hypothetical protein